MQIVIDLDDGIANAILKNDSEKSKEAVKDYKSHISQAIKNGIKLPKNHGTLIDTKDLGSYLYQNFEEKSEKSYLQYFEEAIDNIDAVVKSQSRKSDHSKTGIFPTKKQEGYAKAIAKFLNISLPKKHDKDSYNKFIHENRDAYNTRMKELHSQKDEAISTDFDMLEEL